MPKCLKTDSREIEITEEPITILRCEIEACIPSSAQDKCFTIKQSSSEEQPHELTVTNSGYGDIIVVYSINKNRTIALLNKSTISATGSLDISFEGENVSLVPKVDSTVAFSYLKGESFNILPGDKICSGSKSLIEYIDNDLDDWGDDWF